MSNKVDERITRIRFDNDQFERGVSTSMQSLDRLKNKLESTESINAFTGIQKAADNVNLSGLVKAVETVGDKFNALRLIAINVLSDIVSSAVNAGVSFTKSLSVDNIAAGWQKYGQEVQAVQTIMVTLEDTPIEDVEKSLEKISWFSDETSYSYNEMVGAMSKFISAGTGLDEAQRSVIGVANAAAAAGVSVSNAQRAFYNFSQAMGAGYMSLLDWRSIENLNMATPEFKQNILKTAVAMGKVLKVGEDMYVAADKYGTKNWEKSIFGVNNMSGSLSDKWFDKDVMNNVLGMYSDFSDQVYEFLQSEEAMKQGIDTASEAIEYLDAAGKSIDNVSHKAFLAGQEAKTFAEAIDSVKDAVSTKWKDTFKIIFGNYEEAKGFFTDLANNLYDLFATSGDIRNGILKEWSTVNKELYMSVFGPDDERLWNYFNFPEVKSGRDLLIEGLWNLYYSIVNVIDAIKEAWREIFPQITAERLYKLTAKFREITQKILRYTEDLSGLKTFLIGVFNVFKKVLDFGKSAFSLFRKSLPLLQKIWTLIVKIAEALFTFGKSIIDFINNNVDLSSVIDLVTTGIEKLSKWLDDVNGKDISIPAFKTIINEASKVLTFFEPLKNFFVDSFNFLKGKLFSDNTDEAISKVSEKISLFGEKVNSIGYYFGYFLGNISEVLLGFFKFASIFVGKILGLVGMVVDWITEKIKNFSIGDLLKVFVLGGIAKFIWGLALNVYEILNIAGNLSYVLESLGNILKAKSWQIRANAIKNVAASILIIAGALFIISKIPKEDILRSSLILAGIIAALIGMYYVLQKFNAMQINLKKKKVSIKNGGFIGLALGVLAVVSAIAILAKTITKEGMTSQKLWSIVGVVLVITAVLETMSILVTKFAGKNRLGLATFYPLSLALALLVMVNVFKKIDALEIKSVTKVIFTIIGMLLTLTALSAIMKFLSGKASLGILIFVATFGLILTYLNKISEMSFELNKKTGTIIGVALGLMAIMAAFMWFFGYVNKAKFNGSGIKMVAAAASMLMIAVSFIAIASAFKKLNDIGNEKIVLSTIVILSILGVMSVIISKASKISIMGPAAIIGLSILSLCISVLLGSMALLSKEDIPNMLSSALSVGILLGIMISIVAVAGKINAKSAANIFALSIFTLGLSALVAAIKSLAKEDPGKVYLTIVALGLMLLELVGVYFLLGQMKAKATIAIPALLAITLTAVLMGGLLILFSDLIKQENISSMYATIGALGIVLLEFVAMYFLLSKISAPAIKALPTILILTLTVGLIGGLLILMTTLIKDANSALVVASAISLIAVAFSAALAAVSIIGKVINFAAIIKGITGLSLVAIAIGGFLYLLSEYVDGKKLSWLKDFGGELLVLVSILVIVELLVSAIGLISIVPILTGIAGLTLVALTLSGLLYILTEHINGQNLWWLKAYSDELLGLVGVVLAIEAISAVIGLLGIVPILTGISGIILIIFGIELVIAELYGIIAWIKTKGKFDTFIETMHDLIEVAYVIGEVISAFISGLIFGNLPKIAESLSDFMNKLDGFVQGVKNIPEGFIGSCLQLVSGLLMIAAGAVAFNALNAGYQGPKFLGRGTILGDLTQTLADSADNLQKFLNALGSINNIDVVNAAIPIIEKLSPAITALNDTKTNNLKKVCEKIETVSDAIVKFATTIVSDKNGTGISGVENALNITTRFSNAISNLTSSNKVESINKFIEALTNLATTGIQNFVDAFTSDETSNKLETGLSDMIEIFTNYILLYTSNKDNMNKISNTFTPVINAILDTIQSKYTDFYFAGQKVVDNFNMGLQNKMRQIISTSTGLARAIYKTVNSELQINSPSRRAIDTANNYTMTIANTIEDNLGKIKDKGKAIYEALTSSLSDSSLMDSINSWLPGDYSSVNLENIGKSVQEGVSSIIDPLNNLANYDNPLTGISDLFNPDKEGNILAGLNNGSYGEDYVKQLEDSLAAYQSTDPSIDVGINPVLTDDYGTYANWQEALNSSGFSTTLNYGTEIPRLTQAIIRLEDRVALLSDALKNQAITHSGEVQLRYMNSDDLVDHIQTMIINNIRKEVRG